MTYGMYMYVSSVNIVSRLLGVTRNHNASVSVNKISQQMIDARIPVKGCMMTGSKLSAELIIC